MKLKFSQKWLDKHNKEVKENLVEEVVADISDEEITEPTERYIRPFTEDLNESFEKLNIDTLPKDLIDFAKNLEDAINRKYGHLVNHGFDFNSAYKVDDSYTFEFEFGAEGFTSEEVTDAVLDDDEQCDSSDLPYPEKFTDPELNDYVVGKREATIEDLTSNGLVIPENIEIESLGFGEDLTWDDDGPEYDVRNIHEDDDGIGSYDYFGYRGYDSRTYTTGTITNVQGEVITAFVVSFEIKA